VDQRVLRKLLVLYPSVIAPRTGASWCVSSPANDNVPATRQRSGKERAVAR